MTLPKINIEQLDAGKWELMIDSCIHRLDRESLERLQFEAGAMLQDADRAAPRNNEKENK
jgi:hypothetical protein